MDYVMSDQHLQPHTLQLARENKVRSPLLQYAKNVASQEGEDGVIEKIVNTIPISSKFCVEFGAWDGKHFSNCHNLIKNQGWSGLMIEANPEKFTELKQLYSRRADVITINQYVSFEGEQTLDNILAREIVPEDFGLLSIDIDGNDYHVWDSLSRFSPDIVVIEFNPTIPNDVIFIQEKSHDVNQGCSLFALTRLAKQKGYALACCTSWNAFYVKKEHFPKLGIKDNRIGTLYQPVLDGRIFQGYDGSIHVIGMPQMLWVEKTLSSEDFQVIEPEERMYSDVIKPDD